MTGLKKVKLTATKNPFPPLVADPRTAPSLQSEFRKNNLCTPCVPQIDCDYI